MKVLQINTTVNTGSTGRITEEIGVFLIANGHESTIAYGRGNRPSKSNLIRIGNKWDVYLHGLNTFLFDRHGFASKQATRKLIREIKILKPDLICLHNLHGYYINIEILFKYLKASKIHVIWTLYDCWAFTGHCTYFDDIECRRWIKGCSACPKTRKYPASYFLDRSESNYQIKKDFFSGLRNMHIVVHSLWLKDLVNKSYLKDLSICQISSGIDLEKFSPKANLNCIISKYDFLGRKIILGVANIWDKRKGLDDFIQLDKHLIKGEKIVLVGLNSNQIKSLPKNIVGIERTEHFEELAALYSRADVFVNPTWQDNFPTTNLEAMACGTPVVTYNTGGSPEAIDGSTGIVVPKGDIRALYEAIKNITGKGKDFYRSSCRQRALNLFNKEDRFRDYLKLFESVLNSKG